MFLNDLRVQLIDDRVQFPWRVLTPMGFESEVTGEVYIVPRGFRTDGSSLPKALIAIPLVGQVLAMRYFGSGIWLGFKEGVLHDYLRRPLADGSLPVPARVAHLVFREALYTSGYPPDLCETYYDTVRTFNS